MADEHESELMKAIRLRCANRPVEDVDLSKFFPTIDPLVAKVKVRVPTKAELNAAFDMASAYIKTNLNDADARKDPRVLQDAEDVAIVWHACRDVDDPTHPAFPSPSFMTQHLSADELGVFANMVAGVRYKHSPTPAPMTPEGLDAVIRLAADVGDTDIPDKAMAGWPREVVVHGFILAAMKIRRLEEENAGLREQLHPSPPEEPVDG